MFEELTNSPLLLEPVLSPSTDRQIWKLAVERALGLVGPNRFFRSIMDSFDSRSRLLAQRRLRQLRKRAKLRHVIVDGIKA